MIDSITIKIDNVHKQLVGHNWYGEELHTDPYSRLYYVTEGVGHIETRGRTWPLRKGHCYLIDSNHPFRHIDSPSLDHYWIHFRAFALEGMIRPQVSALLQNYPNPFNPETWIPYKLANDASFVTITIYDAQGQPVRSMNLEQKPAGMYISKGRAVYWDGRNNIGERIGSGVYFYQLRAGEFRAVRKMVILK